MPWDRGTQGREHGRAPGPCTAQVGPHTATDGWCLPKALPWWLGKSPAWLPFPSGEMGVGVLGCPRPRTVELCPRSTMLIPSQMDSPDQTPAPVLTELHLRGW